MANYQILTTETGTANSTPFRLNLGSITPKDGDKAFLGIYGTYGTAVLTLQYKAPNGTYYATSDTISSLGLFELPFSSEVILRLAVTAGGGSSINAVVYNGIAE
jgi:hypothetical protein